MVPLEIFRAYDIRGIYREQLNEETMKLIADAIDAQKIILGHDCRMSSDALCEAFISGFGGEIIDVGLSPIGSAMFFSWKRGIDLAYITASHLTSEWNGLKLFHSSGVGYLEDEIKAIKSIVVDEMNPGKKSRSVKNVKISSITGDYINHLLAKVPGHKKMKIIIDCGNGVSSMIAPELFRRAGYDVEIIFENIDSNFSGRGPDVEEKHLTNLKNKTEQNKCIGIAYDGDGDRVALVDENGNVLTPEQISYIVISELLKKEQGPVVANVECTNVIDHAVKKFNRKVYRVPVGHTFLVENVHKNNASFGVERSGHFSIPSIIPFDDAVALSFYATNVISNSDKTLSELVRDIPSFPSKRTNYICPEKKKFELIRQVERNVNGICLSNNKGDEKAKAEINTCDGVRVDTNDGWFLIRASNTGPLVRLTTQSDTRQGLEKIKNEAEKILIKSAYELGIELREE